MSISVDLLDYMKQYKHVFIQTHNFPDHDSIASAYGLQYILQQYGIASDIIYKGDIQRESLNIMIRKLGINASPYTDLNITVQDKVILVDSCKGNSNVEDLIAEEVAVIDHHLVIAPECIRFVDIRSGYGSCSSIIYEYFVDLGITIPKEIATALLIGLNMDTAQLTRGVSRNDIVAYSELYLLSDITFVNSVLRNYIQTQDLHFYQKLLDNLVIKEGFAFCYFEGGCNQNLLGIMGDFIICLQEIEFVVLCANNTHSINFSIRNENTSLNAAGIIQKVLNGIGFGGGHADMAGGIIKDTSKFDKTVIFEKFLSMVRKIEVA